MARSVSRVASLTASVILLSQVVTANFSQDFHLRDKIVGWDFFSAFEWETMDDPTHGRVNYVDMGTAMNKNLASASDGKFVMRADSNNIVQPGSRGRDSNRIKSHHAYADSLIIIDIQHMPEGCGTWPAFWTLSQSGPWPNGGEIDILEGVNNQAQNLATLHTPEGCTQPQNRDQQGSTVTTDCNALANNNQGCGTLFPSTSSYGAGFNNAGGGWYAMARTAQDGIAVYFWSRNDPSVPRAVRDGSYAYQTVSIDDSWGTPQARFVTDSCDMRSHFDSHVMIFDTTFCGDWAGSNFNQMGCGSNCTEFVDNNPGAFANAYWEINSLRVYTP